VPGPPLGPVRRQLDELDVVAVGVLDGAEPRPAVLAVLDGGDPADAVLVESTTGRGDVGDVEVRITRPGSAARDATSSRPSIRMATAPKCTNLSGSTEPPRTSTY
jgi:hypothetical protein